MDLQAAMQVMLRTHVASLGKPNRANAIALESPPGVGKSSVVQEYCAALAREISAPVGLGVHMLATLQSVDVRGFMLPTKAIPKPGTVFSTPPWYPVILNTTVFLPDGSVKRKGEWDQPIPKVGVCFLDEFGQAEDDTKKAAAELLLHGEVGDDRLPDGWRVIAASNRMSDRAGVLRSLTFITNRRMLLRVDPSLPAWNHWVNLLPEGDRPHHLTISFANRQPDLVFRDTVPPGDDPFCTPRTLVMMDRDLQALRTNDDVLAGRLPTDQVAREVCAGWIGGGESAQYFVHLRYADQLPDMADIERNPTTAKLPEQRDAQMVCAFMLAHNVTGKNADNVLKYITRMNVEMQVLAVRTITNQQEKAKAVANSKQFVDWLLKNQEILKASRG
jgi:hypothetical protein